MVMVIKLDHPLILSIALAPLPILLFPSTLSNPDFKVVIVLLYYKTFLDMILNGSKVMTFNPSSPRSFPSPFPSIRHPLPLYHENANAKVKAKAIPAREGGGGGGGDCLAQPQNTLYLKQ